MIFLRKKCINHISLSFAIAVITLITGCSKRNDNGGTFTVKGRWLKDCSGAAHAGEQLDISFSNYSYNAKNIHEHIGSGFTDAAGNFSVVCENYGSGNLTLQGRPGSEGLYISGGNGHTDDLGTFYDTYTAGAILKFVFASRHADTFFVGRNSVPEIAIYPASGIQVLSISTTGYGKPTRFFQGNYGFGRIDYAKPVNSGSDRIILIDSAYETCGRGDTSVINIP